MTLTLHFFIATLQESYLLKNLSLKINNNKQQTQKQNPTHSFTIEWFNNNHMIGNPNKFQATVLSKTCSSVSHKLNIFDANIGTTKSVKPFGVEVDRQLTFNPHISSLCSAVVVQLNALSRLKRFLENLE